VQDCFTRFLDKHAPSLGQIDDLLVAFKGPEAELMQYQIRALAGTALKESTRKTISLA
jgi:hypothetical protein